MGVVHLSGIGVLSDSSDMTEALIGRCCHARKREGKTTHEDDCVHKYKVMCNK